MEGSIARRRLRFRYDLRDYGRSVIPQSVSSAGERHGGVDMLDPPHPYVPCMTVSSHQDRRSQRYEHESLNVQSGTGGPPVPHVLGRLIANVDPNYHST